MPGPSDIRDGVPDQLVQVRLHRTANLRSKDLPLNDRHMSTSYPPHEAPSDAVVLTSRLSTFSTSPQHPGTLSPTPPLCLDPRNRINVNAEPVTELLYSGFVEHLGRCIYGGLVDRPDDPSPEHLLLRHTDDRPAWRKDVFDSIKHEGELEMPMLRWPGGGCLTWQGSAQYSGHGRHAD